MTVKKSLFVRADDFFMPGDYVMLNPLFHEDHSIPVEMAYGKVYKVDRVDESFIYINEFPFGYYWPGRFHLCTEDGKPIDSFLYTVEYGA